MATKEPFQIDIADLDAIRNKIPEVEAIVQSKREEVSVAQREFAYWQAVLERLRLLAGTKSDGTKPKRAARKESATDVIVRVVDESAVPLRASDIERRMGEDALKRDTISWALWNAAKEERIQKLGTGLYASLTYAPAQQAGQETLGEELGD